MTLERIVIATHNAAKGGEMMTILSRKNPDIKFLSLANYPAAPEPEETGETYSANAVIKAKSAMLHTGLPAIADDAGLEIDALGGAPGVKSKRFGGEDLPFAQKIEQILELLCEVPDSDRTARFQCFVAVSLPHEGKLQVFSATCEGRIAKDRAGTAGFGYDPIFVPLGLERTMAELTADEKHAVSHRGKVLSLVSDYLTKFSPALSAPDS